MGPPSCRRRGGGFGRLGSESAWARRRRRFGSAGEAGGPPSFSVQPVGDRPAAGGATAPDLLHEEPRRWGDLSGAAELVRFAFEGGDCEGVFDTVIEALPLAPTGFAASSFTSQLHVGELVHACLPVTIGGERVEASEQVLRRIPSTPPASAEDVGVRQQVFAELVREDGFRRDLERVYAAARRLRAAPEASPGAEPNTVRRKVTVLRALKDAIDAMASGFEGAPAFLQVELDADGRPTYAFVPGVARTSPAHRVAARLGVTQEELEALVGEKARTARKS